MPERTGQQPSRQDLLNNLVGSILHDLSTSNVKIDTYIETRILSVFDYIPDLSRNLEGLDIDDLVTVLAKNYHGEDKQNKQKLAALAKNLLPKTEEIRYLWETYHESDYNEILKRLFSSLESSLDSKEKLATFRIPYDSDFRRKFPERFFNPVHDFVLHEIRNFNAIYGDIFKTNPDSVSEFYVTNFISEKERHCLIEEVNMEELVNILTKLRQSGKLTDEMTAQLKVIGAAMFPLTKDGNLLAPEELKETVNQMVESIS